MATPVAQIDIQKVLGSEYWTNRYLIDVAVGTQTAVDIATALINAEKPLYFSDIRIDKVRISTVLEGDNTYQAWQPNTAGTRAGTATDRLPLFNVVRIDFGAGLGRPSRKYLRGVLTEIDINGSQIQASLVSGMLMTYAAAVYNTVGVVDPQGDDLDGASVISTVAMRQLRRGSRRRTESVL